MVKTQAAEKERLRNELEMMSGLNMENYEVGGLGYHRYDYVIRSEHYLVFANISIANIFLFTRPYELVQLHYQFDFGVALHAERSTWKRVIVNMIPRF